MHIKLSKIIKKISLKRKGAVELELQTQLCSFDCICLKQHGLLLMIPDMYKKSKSTLMRAESDLINFEQQSQSKN